MILWWTVTLYYCHIEKKNIILKISHLNVRLLLHKCKNKAGLVNGFLFSNIDL